MDSLKSKSKGEIDNTQKELVFPNQHFIGALGRYDVKLYSAPLSKDLTTIANIL